MTESRAQTTWDPKQYLRFADHRFRPALDLCLRVPLEEPRAIYDLGCGTGEVTRFLAQRWPNAEVTGVDHSPQMLAKAAAEPGRIRWLEADLRHWKPDGPADLLFSNATLHWLPEHETLFPKLVSWLAPGGVLAVQMPRSWSQPSHRMMRETLADLGLGSPALLDSLETDPLGEPAAYYGLLQPLAHHVDIWETEYLQALEGPDPVLEWVKGTALRPVLQDLTDAHRQRFLAEYAARLRKAYPSASDGRTLFPFRRLFLIAAV